MAAAETFSLIWVIVAVSHQKPFTLICFKIGYKYCTYQVFLTLFSHGPAPKALSVCRWAVFFVFPVFMTSVIIVRSVVLFKRGAVKDKNVSLQLPVT